MAVCIDKKPTFAALGAIVVSTPTSAFRGWLAGPLDARALGPHGTAKMDRDRRNEHKNNAGKQRGE